MVQITGIYRLERDEDVDKFYKAIGVEFSVRRSLSISKPILQITKDEEQQWTFKTVISLKSSDSSFKLDEKYKENLLIGIVVESVTTMESQTKFVTRSKAEGEGDGDKIKFETHYEFSDEGVVMTLQLPDDEDLVATRHFKRIQ